jgi:hypothetical protein
MERLIQLASQQLNADELWHIVWVQESPRPGDCLKAASHVEITVRDPSGGTVLAAGQPGMLTWLLFVHTVLLTTAKLSMSSFERHSM